MQLQWVYVRFPYPVGDFRCMTAILCHDLWRILCPFFVLDTGGYNVNIKNRSLYLYKNNIQILVYPNEQDHYILHTSQDIFNAGINKRKLSDINNIELWHMRFGHISVKYLTQLVRNGLIHDFTIV